MIKAIVQATERAMIYKEEAIILISKLVTCEEFCNAPEGAFSRADNMQCSQEREDSIERIFTRIKIELFAGL